ncbi:MAG TPA: hypothetical protein VGF33_08885 [Caulobacteraceae bacterium]
MSEERMAQEAAFFANLDAEGVEAVKLRLLARGYVTRERALAVKWLAAKDNERVCQESVVQALHAEEARRAQLRNTIGVALVIIAAIASVVVTCLYYFVWVHAGR